MQMTKVRTIAVSGFVADPDPNVSQPAANQVFDMPNAQMGDQLGSEKDIEGLRFALRFVTAATPPVDVATATADFTAWFYDDGASAAYGRGVWNRYTPEAGAGHAKLFAAPIKGKVFIQVTALGGTLGSAANLEVWAEASTSVMG